MCSIHLILFTGERSRQILFPVSGRKFSLKNVYVFLDNIACEHPNACDSFTDFFHTSVVVGPCRGNPLSSEK